MQCSVHHYVISLYVGYHTPLGIGKGASLEPHRLLGCSFFHCRSDHRNKQFQYGIVMSSKAHVCIEKNSSNSTSLFCGSVTIDF